MTDRPALRVVTLPETDRIVQELHNFVVVMKMFVNYCTVNEGQTAYKNKGQLMQLIREAMYIFMNLYNLISFQRVASFCALRRGKCCSACKCRSPSYRQLHHDKSKKNKTRRRCVAMLQVCWPSHVQDLLIGVRCEGVGKRSVIEPADPIESRTTLGVRTGGLTQTDVIHSKRPADVESCCKCNEPSEEGRKWGTDGRSAGRGTL